MNKVIFSIAITVLSISQAVSAQTVSIHGTVEHLDTGEPVPGRLLRTTRFGPSVMVMISDGVVVVKRDGAWTIENLKPGTIYLRFEPARATQYMVNGAIKLDLTDPEIPKEGIKIYVDDGCAIRGVLKDQNGEPFARQMVHISPAPWYRQLVHTNDAGKFNFHHLERTGVVYSVSTYGSQGPYFKVGPLKEGETFNKVELQMHRRPPEVRRMLTGTVLDTTGAPVPHPIVRLDGGKAGGQGDEKGLFGVGHTLEGSVSASVDVVATLNGYVTQARATIVDGEQITLGEGDVTDGAVIVIEPIPYVKGMVIDDNGEPIRPDIRFLTGKGPQDRLDIITKTGFLSIKPPDGNFSLLFTLTGHQARVLESGRDFDVPVRDLKVVMQSGPFTFDKPVFTAITRRPAEQSEVDAMVGGEFIRESERRLILQAAEAPKTTTLRAPRRPTHHASYTALILDPQGNPVTRLSSTPALGIKKNYPPGGALDPAMVYPNPNETRRMQESATGQYTIKTNDLIWIDGSVPYLVQPLPIDAATPTTITLPTSDDYGGFTVCAVDKSGAPVQDHVLTPESFNLSDSSYTYEGLPQTDAKGCVSLRQLPPGEYVYFLSHTSALHRRRQVGLQLFTVRISAGKITEKKVIVDPAEARNLHERLRTLRNAAFQLDRFTASYNHLDSDTRKDLLRYTIAQLDELPAHVSAMWLHLRVLARVGQIEQTREVREALKRFFLRAQVKNRTPHMRGRLHEVAEAIASIGGANLVAFFEKAAADPEKPNHTKVQAALRLGAIGTPEAVAAYRRLRDAVYERPEGPKPLQNPTHAEKMVETFFMVFEWIPESNYYGTSNFPPISTEDAWVNEDFTEGRLHVGDALHGGTTIDFRRFGDDWIVVHVSGTQIS